MTTPYFYSNYGWQFAPMALSDWKLTYHQPVGGVTNPFDMPDANVDAAHMRIRIERGAGASEFTIVIDGTKVDGATYAPLGGVFDVEYCHTNDGWQRIGGEPGAFAKTSVAYCDETNATNVRVKNIHIDTYGGINRTDVWLWSKPSKPSAEVPAYTINTLKINGDEIAGGASVDTGNQVQIDAWVVETKGVAASTRLALYDASGVQHKASDPINFDASGSQWLSLMANVNASGDYRLDVQSSINSVWTTIQSVSFHLNVTPTAPCIPAGHAKGSATCCKGLIPCGTKNLCTEAKDGCCPGQKMCNDTCIGSSEKCETTGGTGDTVQQHYVCNNGTCTAVVGVGKNECTPTGNECKKCSGFQLGTTCIPMEMALIGLLLVGAVVVMGK